LNHHHHHHHHRNALPVYGDFDINIWMKTVILNPN